MEKKKIKFNIIDAIVALVIIAAVVLVGMRFISGTPEVIEAKNTKYKISFFCEEVPSFAAELVKEGEPVTDDDRNSELGIAEKVTIGPSRTYTVNSEGEINIIPKEGYNSVEVTSIVDAQEFQHGIMVNAAKYGVGHSLTIRVGKAKIWGRVSGLEKVE